MGVTKRNWIWLALVVWVAFMAAVLAVVFTKGAPARQAPERPSYEAKEVWR